MSSFFQNNPQCRSGRHCGGVSSLTDGLPHNLHCGIGPIKVQLKGRFDD